MDFRELLIEHRVPDAFRGVEGIPKIDARMYHPLEVGNFVLSIQASAFHHCMPGEDLEDVYRYESFEVCLTEIVEGKERLISPLHDTRFAGCNWARHWSHGQFMSGIYVPVDQVQQMYHDLEMKAHNLRDQSSPED